MYCKKCGLEIDDETYFCPECGIKIDRSKSRVRSESESVRSEPVKSEPMADNKTNKTSDESQNKQQYTNSIVPPLKNPGIAVILALLIGVVLMGMGQIYAGKVKDGICYLVLGLIIDGVGTIFLISCKMNVSNLDIEYAIIFLLVCIAGISVYIWQIYDAYIVTKEYNDTILKTGKAPW